MRKDYEAYMNDDKAIHKNSVREHFDRYPECDCYLWAARVGGFSDLNSTFTCDRCGVWVEIESLVISQATDEYRALFSSFVRLTMELDWDDSFELCHCCVKELEHEYGGTYNETTR